MASTLKMLPTSEYSPQDRKACKMFVAHFVAARPSDYGRMMSLPADLISKLRFLVVSVASSWHNSVGAIHHVLIDHDLIQSEFMVIIYAGVLLGEYEVYPIFVTGIGKLFIDIDAATLTNQFRVVSVQLRPSRIQMLYGRTHMRRKFMFASAADLTKARCIPLTYRPSKVSIAAAKRPKNMITMLAKMPLSLTTYESYLHHGLTQQRR
eukprot:SAG31_NODE_1960_length_6804_cov_3.421626_3_plen_208_part_00